MTISSLTSAIAEDRRTQVRIRVQIPVKVTMPGVLAPVIAINQDISWGGALLLLSRSLPKEAGPWRITLPWKKDEHITIDAQLLRARPIEGGRYLAAVRFSSLSPRGQSRLVRLLKMLRAGNAVIEGPDTLVRELDVTVDDAGEMRAILTQIATGCYAVTVFDAYEPNQSISLSITGTRDLPGMQLRARVRQVEQAQAKGCDWTNLHRLVLEFEHPAKAIRALAKFFLDQLPEPSGAASQQYAGAPDWLRTSPLARPRSLDLAGEFGKSRCVCALEQHYPEALARLTAGWGDVAAFEVLFRDLVLGDHGHPGGWPADAGEDLELLQNVHDLAYGMSAARRNLLKGGRL